MAHPASPDPLLELQYALAEAHASALPEGLAVAVKAAAFANRPPDQPVDPPDQIASLQIFGRTIDALDELLGSLQPDEWHRATVRSLDVQGLVGHLIGVERDFQRALVGIGETAGSHDHVGATQIEALAQRDRDPIATYAEWRTLAASSVDLAQAHPMAERVHLRQMALPLEDLLVVRAFELWIHTDDVRSATDRPFGEPDPSSVRRMVELSTRLLPLTLRRGDRPTASTVRLVLTGAGGGVFELPLGRGQAASASARIVVDAVDFCRLVGNRVTPAEIALDVAGDEDIAAEVLAGASTLALD